MPIYWPYVIECSHSILLLFVLCRIKKVWIKLLLTRIVRRMTLDAAGLDRAAIFCRYYISGTWYDLILIWNRKQKRNEMTGEEVGSFG